MRYLFILLAIPTMLNAQVDIQGHRGARGIFPENTIPAFIYALDQGVTTLELDVVISKDHQVVVSHEPWISADICIDSAGNSINDDKKAYNMYALNYEQILSFDCGSIGNKNFKEQIKMKVHKPLLSDVIKATQRHMKGTTLFEANYNIEIKFDAKYVGEFHPDVAKFSQLVYNVIDDYLPWKRVTIQSFSLEVLQYWHQHYTEVKLVLLIENLKSVKGNIDALGFTPYAYSPYFKLLNKAKVDKAHEMGMLVVPWTVNEVDKMKELLELGVDGIITDYPNVAREAGLISAKPTK